MKNKILLCAGLLAIGATITLDSNIVIASGLTHEHRSVPKNEIVSQKNAEYYKRSGNAKMDLGDYSAAIADYTRAIELLPNFEKAYYNRGFAKYKLGNYSVAIADYTRAIELLPNNSEAYNNRGIAKGRLRELSGAMADFNQALKFNPNNSAALKNVNELREALREEEERNTVDHINRVRNAQQAGFK